jgi:tRNA(Ile)-lysidine synthase
MENKFILNLQDKCRINFEKPIILGISGGIDSVCMLDLFSKLEIAVIVAHYQHGLRDSAESDAIFVEKLAEKYNFPFEVQYGKIDEIAKIEGLSVEETARNYRYQFLFETAEKYSAQSVAVAHNADDQIETVLMHLLRGSGLSGLAGMDQFSIIKTFHINIPIIRPLLNIWRSEIESYTKLNLIEYKIDPTNMETKYNRNKIRHEILPYLEQSYPGLRRRLWNMALVLRSDEVILENNVNEIFEIICHNHGNRFLELKTIPFINLNEGLQRRLIRRALYEFDSDIRDISFQVIDRAVNFINTKRAGIIDLTNGLTLEATENKFYIFPKGINWSDVIFPQVGIDETILINEPGKFSFGKDWIMEVRFGNRVAQSNFERRSSTEAIIDFDQIGGFPINLGSGLKGDRFKPLGMEKGSIKLSDFFINCKLPKSARIRWPILRNSKNEIIWIPGFRPAHQVRISNNTKRILELIVKRI